MRAAKVYVLSPHYVYEACCFCNCGKCSQNERSSQCAAWHLLPLPLPLPASCKWQTSAQGTKDRQTDERTEPKWEMGNCLQLWHWKMSLAIVASCRFCSNIFWQPSICTNSQLHMQQPIPLPHCSSPSIPFNKPISLRHKRIARASREFRLYCRRHCQVNCLRKENFFRLA